MTYVGQPPYLKQIYHFWKALYTHALYLRTLKQSLETIQVLSGFEELTDSPLKTAHVCI